MATLEEIRRQVTDGLARLPPHLRLWAEAHLVAPRAIKAALDPDGSDWMEFILVTDDTGDADGSYRVVYDSAAHGFGLVVVTDAGILWYMGEYGGFDEAVTNM